MGKHRFIAIGMTFILLIAGSWLLVQPGALPPEAASRRDALRRYLAPSLGARPGASQRPPAGPVTPVLVDLRAIPARVYDPNNAYDRWQRGEIDLDEQEARRSPAEIAVLQEAAYALPADHDVRQLSAARTPLAPSLLLGFDSLDVEDCCGGGTAVPPDSHLAPGPQHLIVAVNLAFAVYDKTGTRLTGPTTFASFFNARPDCIDEPDGAFDPTVIYDEEAGRYILTVDGNGDHICMAVTTGSDPTVSWYLYAFPAELPPPFNFFDYPHTGVGKDAIFLGSNNFNLPSQLDFEGRVYAFDKWALYSGAATSPTSFSTGTEGTPQPLHLHGYLQGAWPTDDAHYFITDPYDGCTLRLWRWPNALDGGAPATAATFNLCTASGVTAGMPIPAPQSVGMPVEANDYRYRGFEYHDGHAWAADSISCNPGGGTVNCVRWTELDLTTSPPSLVQSAVFASTGVHRTFPDLAVNRCGDMAIGYNKFSSSTFPSLWISGRKSVDPLGTLGAEASVKAGETGYASYDPPPHRWGDYASMAIDPDGATFWQIGEYAKLFAVGVVANWGNYVASFRFNSCPPFALAPDSLLNAGPGTHTTHHFVLSNYSNAPTSFDLALSPGDWNTTLLAASPLAVGAGASVTVSVRVDVPHTASGSDAFSLTATQVSNPALSTTATGTTLAAITTAVDISGDVYSQEGATGSTLTYWLTIANAGSYTDTFDITLGPSDWQVTSQSAATPALGPGQSTANAVEVVVGQTGESDSVTVTVASRRDPAVAESVTFTTTRRFVPLYLPLLER